MTRGRWLPTCLVMLALVGCVRPERRTVELVYLCDRAGLLQELRRRADTVTTLKAKLNIHFESAESDGPQSCDGLLRYQAPDKVRLRGDRDFVGQVFDLVSDGERYSYWFMDPETRAPGTTYTGSLADLAGRSEGGLASLSQNFGELLGLLRLPEETEGTRLLIATYPDRWLIDLVSVEGGRLELLRRWWVDRVDLACRRIEAFGEDGELAMEVGLGEHKAIGPGLALIAREVRFHWPSSRDTLTFELSELKANEPVRPTLFQVRVPEGVETVPPE